MSVTSEKDWDPGTYARFRGLRLRPAMDLLAQVDDLPAGDVVDLGCGNGPAAVALRLRFPDHLLIGVDNSPAMLKIAGAEDYDALYEADALVWQPTTPPSLIFSNALCHWLPDHPKLFNRLACFIAPGGTLAVQMPRQYMAPSHKLLRSLAWEMFPDRFEFCNWQTPVAPPADYARMLSPLGEVKVWETQYLQRLSAVEAGHPVRHFTQSTGMRPFVDKMDEAEKLLFTTAYDVALATPYPVEDDGSVLFPFRRVFFVLNLPS